MVCDGEWESAEGEKEKEEEKRKKEIEGLISGNTLGTTIFTSNSLSDKIVSRCRFHFIIQSHFVTKALKASKQIAMADVLV